jgi:hypothetical protein
MPPSLFENLRPISPAKVFSIIDCVEGVAGMMNSFGGIMLQVRIL